jgi:hypothetical protein
MSGGLSKRQIQGIKKMLSYDHLKAKEFKKKKRLEKANRPKGERHKSRQQEIEELLNNEIENELDAGGEL